MKPKLVRNKIPEKIADEGFIVTFHTLSDEEYVQALHDKLDEEVAEFHMSGDIDELADIMEVINALALAKWNQTIDEVEYTRAEKFHDRGGFSKRYFIDEVRGKDHGRK